MISKRILLVVVCVALLILAVGVYAYKSINKMEEGTFVFEWSSEEQSVVDGTLRMKLKFAIDGENLSVLAEINDYAYYGPKLVLVFDMNQSGEIEVGEPCYVFLSTECRSPNLTDNAWWNGHGGYSWECGTVPSPYHTLIQDESGVSFIISIPLEELNLVNDLVIVSYRGAWKQLNFGLEV